MLFFWLVFNELLVGRLGYMGMLGWVSGIGALYFFLHPPAFLFLQIYLQPM